MWLTSLEAIGIALTLAALWLAPRRREIAIAVGALATIWMPFALVVFALVWALRHVSHTRRWAAITIILAPLIFVPPREEHLLMLLAGIAIGGASAWPTILATLTTLLFVLHAPIAPFLFSVENRAIPVLAVGVGIGMGSLQVSMLGQLIHRQRLRAWGGWLGIAGMLSTLLLAAVVGVADWRTFARAQSPYASLLDTLAVAPAGRPFAKTPRQSGCWGIRLNTRPGAASSSAWQPKGTPRRAHGTIRYVWKCSHWYHPTPLLSLGIPVWAPGTVIQRIAIAIPPDIPAGTYALIIGRYIPATGEHVLLVDGTHEYQPGTITIQTAKK